MSAPIPNVRYKYDDRVPGWVAPGRPTLPVGRDQLVPGFYFPDATNTGLLTDVSALTLVTANQTYSTTTTRVISNMRFRCFVYVTGSNITFRNCLFEGPNSSPNGSQVSNVVARYAGSNNIVFEDCLFDPIFPSATTDNLMGRGFTARRCEFRNAVDGLGAAPADGGTRVDVSLHACWIHDLAYYSPFSGQSDNKTHNDGIQWHGGAGLTLIGNRIEAYCDPTIGNINDPAWNSIYPKLNATSAVMVNQQGTLLPSEMYFEKNWIDGGYVGINMIGVPTAFPAGANPANEIIGNHFGFDFSTGTNNAIVGKAAQVYTLTGNYRWFKSGDPFDTSTPFNVRQNG